MRASFTKLFEAERRKEMTKQNDMPDTIYLIHHADGEGNHAWSTDPDPTGYIQEVDTTKYVRAERADKPADNGGECIRCKGTGIVECTTSPVDYDINEPPPENEVCICRKIAAHHDDREARVSDVLSQVYEEQDKNYCRANGLFDGESGDFSLGLDASTCDRKSLPLPQPRGTGSGEDDLIVFTEEETQKMSEAQNRAYQAGKGHYETLYTIASVVIRSRNLLKSSPPPEVTTCPDGMSCSGNGMDCVGDGLCKGVSHVNDINVADIPQAIENIGPNTTPEVSGDVDIPKLRDEFVAMDWFRHCEAASDIVLCTLIEMQQRNLLKSEGVSVPGNTITKIHSMIGCTILGLSSGNHTYLGGEYIATFNPDILAQVINELSKTLDELRPFLPAEKE